MLEQSVYLPAWRAAVKRGTFEAYRDTGIEPARLPLFAAGVPVIIEVCKFYVAVDQCRADGTDEPTGTPDIDKLLRSTLDALGGGRRDTARLFADDSQVVAVLELTKERARLARPGAWIVVSDGRD